MRTQATFPKGTLKDGTVIIGEGVGFTRIRRITGYLVGDVEQRFNNAKKAEVNDRRYHMGRQTGKLPPACCQVIK